MPPKHRRASICDFARQRRGVKSPANPFLFLPLAYPTPIQCPLKNFQYPGFKLENIQACRKKNMKKSSINPLQRVIGCKETSKRLIHCQGAVRGAGAGESVDSSCSSSEDKAAWNGLWLQHIKYCVAQFDAKPGRSSRGKGCSSLPAGRGEIWGLNHLAGKEKKQLTSSFCILRHPMGKKK